MGLYDGTPYAYLDEPRTIKGPFCKDCVNFIPDGEFCAQARLADFVHGKLDYRMAQDCRYGGTTMGLNCGIEGLWFLPKP